MPTRCLDPNAKSIITLRPCEHPDHNAKTEGLAPGSYAHDCPGCKTTYIFTVTERDRKG